MQPRPSPAGADVDRTSPTTTISSNEPEVRCVPDSPSSGTRKRRSKSPCRTQQPPPVRLNCFWASSVQEMPIYHCSPWDFYKPFLTLDEKRMLVLCNHNTVARVIRTYLYPTSTSLNISQIQHRNFINYYEAYLFKGQLFSVSEHIDFSLEEMLDNALYPTEREIAYIIGQILARIRFIECRRVGDSTLSGRTVRISREGKVKIDPTLKPIDGEGSSADVSSLRPLMLSMMNETQETLKATSVHSWSHEAIDFVQATSWATTEELFEHTFLTNPGGSETLVALCEASSFMIKRDVKPLEAFSERFNV